MCKEELNKKNVEKNKILERFEEAKKRISLNW